MNSSFQNLQEYEKMVITRLEPSSSRLRDNRLRRVFTAADGRERFAVREKDTKSSSVAQCDPFCGHTRGVAFRELVFVK